MSSSALYPNWLGAASVSLPNGQVSVTNTIYGSNTSNVTTSSVDVVPRYIFSGLIRKQLTNNTEVNFITLSNAPAGIYMGTYNVNVDVNGGGVWSTTDTLDFYFNGNAAPFPGSSSGAEFFCRPLYMATQDTGDDVYISLGASFSNDRTQDIRFNVYYSANGGTPNAGVFCSCYNVTLQKIA